MKSVSIYDKIEFIRLMHKIGEQIWKLARESQEQSDRHQLDILSSRLNKILNEYNKITKLCNEFQRFNSLHNGNKYDDLLSFMKAMNRLDISPELYIDLNKDFDFNHMWTIINDNDEVILYQYELNNSLIQVMDIIESVIEVHKKQHDRFSDNLRNLWVI